MSQVIINPYRFGGGGGGGGSSFQATSTIDHENDDGWWVPATSAFNVGTVITRLGLKDGSSHHSWYLFPGLVIPQGATITGASFELRAYDSKTGNINLLIRAEDADDGVAPTSSVEAEALTLTTASVAWQLTSVADEGLYETPNLASVIEEVVGRVGWVSGNSILITIKDDGTSTQWWQPRAASTSYPMTLTVDYTTT